jgi:acetyl/propionyl-CoA carboxylase alpha subunit
VNACPDISYTIQTEQLSFKKTTDFADPIITINLFAHNQREKVIASWQSRIQDNSLNGLLLLSHGDSDTLGELIIASNTGDFRFIFSNAATGKEKHSQLAQNKSYLAPLNGRVIAVNCKQGDKVKKDQEIVVIEAMKMEHVLRAREDGVIEKINVRKDQQVESSKILFTLKA